MLLPERAAHRLAALATQSAVGSRVLHKATSQTGQITKLARNEKGLVEAHCITDDGGTVTGSPTLGRDFERAEAKASKEAFGKQQKQSQAQAARANEQDDIEVADDEEWDLDAIQKLEDEAIKERERRQNAARLVP